MFDHSALPLRKFTCLPVLTNPNVVNSQAIIKLNNRDYWLILGGAGYMQIVNRNKRIFDNGGILVDQVIGSIAQLSNKNSLNNL